MFTLILSAIGLGLMLSLVFIGPIFFLLIETSFSRGPKHAIVLDLGVIFADILCILAAYYASGDIIYLIDKHPGFYKITALLVFIYGVVMMVSKTKMHVPNEEKLINQNYLRTFINGFLFNLLNIGVLLFWLVTVISIRNKYPHTENFLMYIAIVLATYFGIDLLKIFLAKQFHNKLTDKLANRIRTGVGLVLVIFSIFIFMQSIAKYNSFDKKLEQAESEKAVMK